MNGERTLMTSSIVFLISTTVLVLVSCSYDERQVNPVIENEALTTVRLNLVNASDASDTTHAQWEQLLDNNGKPMPVDISQADLSLKAQSTYNATLVILDKTQRPPDTLSQEIKVRGNYHLFFFQPLPTNQPLAIPNNY